MDYREYSAAIKSGDVVVNTHGHAVRTDSSEFEMILMMSTPRGTAGEAVERMAAGGKYDLDLEFPIVKEGSYSFQCGKCGKKPTVTIHEDRIEFEDNHVEPQAFSVDIEFPSGEMLFNDTYPDCFRSSSDFDVNTVAGVQECSEDMAKQGLMHFFVGNSCPAVWKEGDTIYVGRLPEDDWDNADGSICTDLWWASFVDPDIVRSQATAEISFVDVHVAKDDIKYMREKGGSIKVTPGTYRCTSYYHLGGLDYSEDEKQVFCKLEKI